MTIALLGIDHTQMAIEAFEPIFLNKQEKQQFFHAIKQQSTVDQCVVLTTCNRVEIYIVAADITMAIATVKAVLVTQKNVTRAVVDALFQVRLNDAVLTHLFEVAAGVQSMVFGENEILTQVKQAYEDACAQALTGAHLNKCFQAAIAAGKRVRTETSISRGAYSVSSIAIDAIREKQRDYFDRSILIIGMGTMGVRCLKKLYALGHPSLSISNRTPDVALRLVDAHDQVASVAYQTVCIGPLDADIIISAVAVSQPLITQRHLLATKKQLFIDLGLPRNIDPQVAQCPHATLINVDGLKDIATTNVKRRKAELAGVMLILNEEKERVIHWMQMKQTHGTNV